MSPVIEEFFVRRIHRIIGGLRFYQRKEMTCWRICGCWPTADNVNLQHINVPRRGIGCYLRRVIELAAEQSLSYYEALFSLSEQLREKGERRSRWWFCGLNRGSAAD